VADPEKLAGTAVAALLCCGAKVAGCPGTLNGAGELCSGVAAEAEVGAAWGGADTAERPGPASRIGAGAGVASDGGSEVPGCPGTLNGTGALCG
jgi:hypothetical protein